MKSASWHGSWGETARVSPHDRVLWVDQPFLVTNQNRKMNDGSSVLSTPDIPLP